MANFSRRDFLKTGLAATALAGAGSLGLAAAKQSATDMVTLGNSGVKVTRLAFGTGTMNGRVQRDLGQEGFNRLVRYAYDRGIRFFETAQSYPDMHRMLGVALKGIPRDSYQLMTKVTTWGRDRAEAIARMLRALAEYQIAGVPTTSMFCRFVLSSEAFREGRFSTHFVDKHFNGYHHDSPDPDLDQALARSAASLWVSAPGVTAETEPSVSPEGFSPWRRKRGGGKARSGR